MAITSVQVVINGETFQLAPTENGRWRTIITAPGHPSNTQPNGYYPVEITAINGNGYTQTVNDKTASIGLKLQLIVRDFIAVYDRNLLDITYAKELIGKIYKTGFDSLAEQERIAWNGGLKGFLNYTDLNRIEENCEIVAGLLSLNVSTKRWKMGDLPTLSDFRRIHDNVARIREKRYAYQDTPQVPLLPLNTYKKINDIEKIVYDAFWIMTLTREQTDYIGEIYMDEELGVI